MTTTTPDVHTIAKTRAFYADLAQACDADIVQIELALAHLVQMDLDQATLDGFQSTQDDALRAAARCRATAATLDAIHSAMEEAVNATPDAAKTDFYRDGTVPAATSRGDRLSMTTEQPSTPGAAPALGSPEAADRSSSGAVSNFDPDQAKETSVDEDDSIDPLTGMRQETLAAFRAYNKATYPFLTRRTEVRRIEDEHDARRELVDRGHRTAEWYRAARAVLLARTEEIDRMVASLRPGDQVCQADDPNGVVWTVRETRDGNDGWVWLGLLRAGEDDIEVATGCRARGVDLVAAATDDEHAAAVKAELLSDLRTGYLTQDAYEAALSRLAAAPNTGSRR